MIHARDDYNGIQDPECCTSIAEDEPVFLLRGRDALAPDTIRYWANLLLKNGGNTEDVKSVLLFVEDMEKWQSVNETKTPDTPDGQRWSEK